MRCNLDDRTLFLDNSDVDFRIDKAEVDHNEKSEWMALKMEVTDGNGGRNVVFDNVFPWKMGEVLTAIGKPPVDKEFDVEPDDLIGQTGRCRVYIDDFQGKTKNKVRAYLPATKKPTLDEDGAPDDLPF